MDNELEKSEGDRANIFHDFVKAKVAAGEVDTKAKEIMAEAERLEVTNKAPIILCELLLGDTIVAQVREILCVGFD